MRSEYYFHVFKPHLKLRLHIDRQSSYLGNAPVMTSWVSPVSHFYLVYLSLHMLFGCVSWTFQLFLSFSCWFITFSFVYESFHIQCLCSWTTHVIFNWQQLLWKTCLLWKVQHVCDSCSTFIGSDSSSFKCVSLTRDVPPVFNHFPFSWLHFSTGGQRAETYLYCVYLQWNCSCQISSVK